MYWGDATEYQDNLKWFNETATQLKKEYGITDAEINQAIIKAEKLNLEFNNQKGIYELAP